MKYQSNASTVSGEVQRQVSQQNTKSIHKSLQRRLGTISQVHEKLPMVKVVFENGVEAAAGEWIPLAHSVLDIIHRFGSVRNGLRVEVTYSGEVELGSTAIIVGVEGEKLGNEIQELNDIETGPWELLGPGR